MTTTTTEDRPRTQAAQRWACDSCRVTGYGGGDLLSHAAATGHRHYTRTGGTR